MAYDELHDQEIVTVRIPKDTIKIVDQWAKDEDRTRANIVRRFVIDGVNEKVASQKKGGKK